MKGDDIASRLLDLGVVCLKLATELETSAIGKHVARQLIRSSTSGGANDEEARSAEISADVAHKVSVAAKELGESVYWLKLIHRANRSSAEALTPWIEEGQQLVRILAASARTAKGRSLSESAAAPQLRLEKQTTCLGGRVSGRTSSMDSKRSTVSLPQPGLPEFGKSWPRESRGPVVDLWRHAQA